MKEENKMPGTNRLSRTKGARDALLKGLVTSLIQNGKVETTLAKAKEVKPLADSIISLAIKEAPNFELKEKSKYNLTNVAAAGFEPALILSFFCCSSFTISKRCIFMRYKRTYPTHSWF